MTNEKLLVAFFRSDTGVEPVRDWLKTLEQSDRRIIGEDIKTVQFGWLLGMPVVRKMAPGLWEVRSQLVSRIARILFTVEEGKMVLLHGFIKKTQKTPDQDLSLTQQRLALLRRRK
ncbi:MAG: type II toxin-antitoxin system RelE/ParE family toxin [Magnetococcales bacterium]|nr:type II toxin-antitoxin system RelE/ParE family toxin [Magnetococcales bacterium]MBF0437912.1 type II toxin-antitoxin system RelE/ParE family toxin [Magnetococcales bacterium]